MKNVLVRRLIQAVICPLGLLMLAPLAWAQQNSIETFDVTQSGGQVLVRVNLKGPIAAAPGSFTIANPARIAFDFADTTNGLGRNSQDIGEAALRSMNVVQVGDRTRLVLNLRNMVPYESKVEGNSFVITLSAAAPGRAGAAATGAPTFAEGRSDVSHSLQDVNFRRGRGGEGRIVVELSDPSTGVDIRQQGQTVIVDFLKTSISEVLRKRYDVVDFATPVQTFSVFPQGDNVRMVIEPRGLWEHNAYQTDTQFVLEVKPIQYDPNKLVQGSRIGYSGEKLSLNFQNVEVRSVLNVIADFTDLNIITSDTVGGNLTLRLKDVPWDQALDIILQAKGLSKRKNGNVVLIAPTDELAAKEKLALEAQAAVSDLEPVRTESFALSYAKAADIQTLLTSKDQRILSKRGAASVDERTNTIFVQDTGGRLEEARRLILQLDVPVRQVLIEARIVIADDKWGRQLGARFGTQSAFNTSNYNVGVSGSLLDTTAPATNNPVSRGSSSLTYNQGTPNLLYAVPPQVGTIPIGAQPEQLNVNLPVVGA